MLEKRLAAISPQFFTSDGTANGCITVSDATLFKVKQEVYVVSDTQPSIFLEVKEISDENTLYLGPKSSSIHTRFDLSAFLLLDNAFIAANEQQRPSIPFEEIVRATYEEEPAVATRVIPVDKLGRPNSINNPYIAEVQGARGLLIDRSGETSAIAETSMQLAPANENRKYFILQNLSNDVELYLNFGADATINYGSFKVVPNAVIVFEDNFIVTQTINVITYGASIPFTAKEST